MENDSKWADALMKYLDNLLGKILGTTYTNKIKGGSSTMRDLYLDTKSMAMWIQAFTHNSFDLEKDKNYEGLEYYGDKMLKSVFAKYALDRHPNHTHSEYNEIDRINMSTNKQGVIAGKLGFTDHVRVDPLLKGQTFAIGADIFESFTGALAKISDSVMPGYGFMACYKFMTYIFDNGNVSQLELKNIAGNPKTIYVQIFRQFGFARDQIPSVQTTGITNKLFLSNPMRIKLNDILLRAGSQVSVQNNLIAQLDNTNKSSVKSMELMIYQSAVNN